MLMYISRTCQRTVNLLEDLLSEQVNKSRDYLIRERKTRANVVGSLKGIVIDVTS